MNPSRDVLALSTTEVDLTPIAVGSAVTVVWRGKPVFVRHRTAEEIKAARDTPLSELPDPAAGPVARQEGRVAGAARRLHPSRLRAARAEAVRRRAAITAAGSAPATAATTTPRAASGRGRRRLNLAVPDYVFTSDTQIRIG